MARKLFRKYMPHPDRIRKDRWLGFLGTALHDPNLWHLNLRSVSRAFAIGLFWAFIPMPFQMIPAAILSIWTRANLGLSIALVWLTNPFTMVPIWYVAYHLGRWCLGQPSTAESFEWTVSSLMAHFNEIWLPVYIGSVLLSIFASFAGYHLVKLFWRWHVGWRWTRRDRTMVLA